MNRRTLLTPPALRWRARRALPAPVLAVAGLLLLGVTGCSAPASERPLVVVTTNILGDVVENVVGDQAEVMVLMRPNADPHSFEISAQEAARILDADLLVSNGLGLEEGLQQHMDAAESAGVPVFTAGDVIDVLEYGSGDAAGASDPHFWTDPDRMHDVVAALSDAVNEFVPGVDTAQVDANAEAYAAELTALAGDMTEAFAAIPAGNRNLVTNHHVFGYLADRFDFTLIGTVIPGGTTLAAPSASDLRDLTEAIETAGVPTVFAESSQPDRLVQVLANEAGIDVAVVELFTESLTETGEGADTYLTMMRANTERIATGLSP
ncbi:zinc/manganese transport system substrate-binding protein [Glaciihabitans tibetensis]|uniref:Zinc/manganese transport system substrate-binding protein n=1 Tax=Glaciihabitans tibetensis TaxID=1266600 RepID=A0A2T0V6T3_9MICO|nr:zinc ABC transporter substrate-binding protein AztC [Glaciihabitans tibetensis]PRY65883.1 zinc/manganese transport system substrate-binding protein [Glaciihabitans tibetensis]